MKKNKNSDQLSKFLSYVLGRRPDEFGLVPDEDGFFKIKEVIKALSEDPGWRHVRLAHINELFLTLTKPRLERSNDMIRAEDQSLLPKPEIIETLPKLLFTCIRRRAQQVVYRKGLFPMGQSPYVIMSLDKDMAFRMGKRRDSKPIMLTVQTARLLNEGQIIYCVGELIFLTHYLPKDCFTGPPLPKEKEKPASKPDKTKETSAEQKEYGSFFLDIKKDEEKAKLKRKRAKKEIGWKKDARKMRRRKKF
ncbi:RNA 2'-phosphotransferase [Candidatus Magnetomoraceae bacterium gMMP-1]